MDFSRFTDAQLLAGIRHQEGEAKDCATRGLLVTADILYSQAQEYREELGRRAQCREHGQDDGVRTLEVL